MPIESPYMTYYLMAIVIFALSFIISKIFTVQMCTALTLTFRMVQILHACIISALLVLKIEMFEFVDLENFHEDHKFGIPK